MRQNEIKTRLRRHFNSIDYDKKNFVKIDSFFADLKSNGVEFADRDLDEIVKRYEINEGGHLPYKKVIHDIEMNLSTNRWRLKRPEAVPQKWHKLFKEEVTKVPKHNKETFKTTVDIDFNEFDNLMET